MSFTGAASTVVAKLFQLVDDTGRIIAKLASGTVKVFGSTLAQNAGVLELNHNDASGTVTDQSALKWTVAPSGTVAPIERYVELITATISGRPNMHAALQMETSSLATGRTQAALIAGDSGFLSGGGSGTGEPTAYLSVYSDISTGFSQAYIQSTDIFNTVQASVETDTFGNVTLANTVGLMIGDTVNVARSAYVMFDNRYARSSAAITPAANATVIQDIPGTSVFVDVRIGDIVFIDAMYTIQNTAVNSVGVGLISINGVTQIPLAVQGLSTSTSTNQGTVFNQIVWVSTVTANVEFKLQGRTGNPSPANSTFVSGNCSIKLQAFTTK